MKAGKIILGLIVVVVVAIGIGVFVGLKNLDGIVKAAIEQEAPKVTGTPVTLDQVKITLTEGRGELHGLQIDNPKGYGSAYAFNMGEIALQIDPASVTKDVIVIKEVLIDGAKLIAEQKEMTKTNLQDLLNHVKQATGANSGTAQPTTTETESEGSDVRLMIEKFTFSNSNIQLITQEWGEKTVKLPTIALTNIGDKTTGLTPAELSQAVLDPILTQAKTAITKQLKELAKDKAEAELKSKLDEKLDDEQKAQLNQLKGLFGK